MAFITVVIWQKGKHVSRQLALFFHDPSEPIFLALHNDQTIKSGAQIYPGSWFSQTWQESFQL